MSNDSKKFRRSQSGRVSKCPTEQPHDETSAITHANKATDSQHLLDVSPQPAPADAAQTGHPATNLATARTFRDIPGLSERQMHALDLLAEGTPDSKVATTISVDRRTIYRWRRHPIFKRELERLITDLRGVARDRVNLLLPAAFETFNHHLSNPASRSSLSAAQFIIRLALGNSLELSPTEKAKEEQEEMRSLLASKMWNQMKQAAKQHPKLPQLKQVDEPPQIGPIRHSKSTQTKS